MGQPMDREQVRRWESQCIQEQAPACTAACPMHVDARKLAECTRKGDFRGGFAVLAAAVPLPAIVAHICDHPCQRQCRRIEAGDAIQIHAFERACATFGGTGTSRRAPTRKNQRVLIVGGQLSSVSAAILVAQKGYQVTLRESGHALLGSLRGLGDNLLPQHAIDSDLEALEALDVGVETHHESAATKNLAELASLRHEFDAVFFEARTWPSPDPGDPLTLATQIPGVFAGNAWQELSPIFAVYEGSVASISIDRFLQGASLTANRENQGSYPSRLFVNTSDETHPLAVEAANPDRGYTREEAQREASRCFPCQCLECVKVCEYLKQYGSYPKRYVREIYNNECIVMGVRKANRMINSCALCGLCTAVCPEKLSMADVCLDARRGMVEKSRMPPSAHDFALRDMTFSTSEAFRLARHQPGFTSSAVAFLPGCQLSASSPGHVESCYRHLRGTLAGGVGLILSCCGAPALWAGDEPRFRDTLGMLSAAWEQLGRPRLITACSSCYRTLRAHQPQIPVEPLWPHLENVAIPSTAAPRTMALHDPCSTRNYPEVENSARSLLRLVGVQAEELNDRGLSTCCGFGGLVQFANPALADRTVGRRAGQSSLDYVTYCAMCRDRFSRQGKRAVHILDLVFPSETGDPAARPDPGFSRRQEDRARLKTRMLREVWNEWEDSVDRPLRLEISDEIRELLEKRMILVDDVHRVIEHAEGTGEKLQNPATGNLLASWRPSCVTYWVEYSAGENAFVVHNAYSHRMQVK
jgi:glutamate synthase (NADPH/NADH) small chain